MMKKQNKIYLGIGIVAVVIIIAVVMLSNQQKGDETIKIGVVAPFTGDAAIYGDSIQKSIQIAMLKPDYANVEVIYEDACLANDALKVAPKLAFADQVDLISNVFCIPAVQPLASVTNDLGLSITMSAAVPDTLLNQSFVFSPNSAIKDEAMAQADYVYNKLSLRTASIVWMNSDFGKSYSDNFKKRFEELGGQVLSNEPLEFFGTDYRAELTRVKAKNPDVMLAIHFGNQLTFILKQSFELALSAQIIGTYEGEDSDIINVAGNAAEGFIISTPVGSEKGDNYFQFENTFVEKYGREPSAYERISYDGFNMQIEAYKNCEGERKCIIDYLGSIKNYDGASGIFSINEEGTADRSFVFKKIQDGKYVVV